MALRDLVKAVSPEFATDREIQGDQVDLKINDLRRDLWAVCDAIDGSIGPAGNKLGYYYYSQGSPTEGNIYGTWDSVKLGLKAVRGWPVNIRLEPGLTPIAGDILYVSETTAGLATNVIPATLGNYVKPIGHVLNALAYSPLDMTGSVVTGLLDIDAAKVI